MASITEYQKPSKLRLFYQKESIIGNDPFPLFQRDQPQLKDNENRLCQFSQSCSYSSMRESSDNILWFNGNQYQSQAATNDLQLLHGKQPQIKRDSSKLESTSSLAQREISIVSKTSKKEGASRRMTKIACFLQSDYDDDQSSSSFENEIESDIYGLDFMIQSPTPAMTSVKQQLNRGIKGMKIKNLKSGDSKTVSILSQDKKLKKKMSEISQDSSENYFMSSISTDDD